ncbi:hypothetical protein Vi05172_g9813 [Venturia inaequalis]|nr:hypothetical protein Vi05172_g9813 [Venturia inaequalis]
MPAKGLVLISGVNGYIASRTAETFLKAGYSIRGTVRSLESGKTLLNVLSEYATIGQLEIVTVPDITVDEAFDEAVKGVTAICHMASPVSFSFTDPDYVINTAVGGTVSILKSALKAGEQLKSVIYISSIAAIVGPQDAPYTFTEKDWNSFSEGEVARLGGDAGGPQIYLASKTAAERAFWKFREEHKPNFSQTAVNPVFVTGPPLLLPETPGENGKNINETVRDIYQILAFGKIVPAMLPSPSFVDNRDVARIMLFTVVEARKCDGERFIACGGRFAEQAIADILRKQYPDREIEEGSPGQGYLPDFSYPKDGIAVSGKKIVEFSGVGYLPYKQSVLEAAKAFEIYL